MSYALIERLCAIIGDLLELVRNQSQIIGMLDLPEETIAELDRKWEEIERECDGM